MDKEKLLTAIKQFFIDNSKAVPKDITDEVEGIYREVRSSHILPYEPIKVKRRQEKAEGYEAEITQKRSRSLDDASLTHKY